MNNMRIIDPPKSKFEKFPTPLTFGERQLIELFDENLPSGWEMYVQPHLNGLRPDLVLLNPLVGIAVFEVKDLDLGAMQYWVSNKNPIRQILSYKDEIFDLYCPRLNGKAGRALITAGLVFTKADRHTVEQVFGSLLAANPEIRKYPDYYPIAGAEDMASKNLGRIFPEYQRTSSQYMTKETADDLRAWLKEPAFSQEQRRPLELDERQRELVSTRTETGYRRVKGPAGSGKSMVLVARAAELADTGKRVLVVCYNITLLNYLRDFAVRHVTERSVIKRKIDFLNFHHFCKRVCIDSDHEEEYRSLWNKQKSELILNEQLPDLVKDLYKRDCELPKYDAILVDEGQDFSLKWWQTLQCALQDGGEMMLVADKTQNIYGTATEWTENPMVESGFRGPWSELKVSYRLPPSMIKIISVFAEKFLVDHETDIPLLKNLPNQQELELDRVELRWSQVRDPKQASDVCEDELIQMMRRLYPDTAITDITLLCHKEIGLELVESLRKRKNIHALHTFGTNKIGMNKKEQNIYNKIKLAEHARRQKRAFFQGAANIKATTLHSFKGWEARHLVVFVDKIDNPNDKALLYTALTRVRRHQSGSSLTVVSSCDDLRSFGKDLSKLGLMHYEEK